MDRMREKEKELTATILNGFYDGFVKVNDVHAQAHASHTIIFNDFTLPLILSLLSVHLPDYFIMKMCTGFCIYLVTRYLCRLFGFLFLSLSFLSIYYILSVYENGRFNLFAIANI